MKKTSSENLRLGVFVIIGTVLLLIAAYAIGSRQNMFGQTFKISAVFKNVNGLQEGNNVRFSGIVVGTVNRIEMINDTTIRVNMIIEEEMLKHIRKDAIATVGSDGLVGSMIINITPGKGKAPLVKSGDEIRSYSRIATEDMLNTLNVTNENAALLTSDLLKVTRSLVDGKGTLGRLLNDTAMANSFWQTIENIEQISLEANTTMQEINGIVENINFEDSPAGILLSDSISGKKIKAVITNLETSVTEINKITANLDTVVSQIKNGKGALNYLTTDTTFVDKLDATMRNIEQGTERFNQNMEALKHNFLFRGYFRKLEREAERSP